MWMLLTEYITIDVSGNVKYYENLGYEIQKYKNKQGELRVKKGTLLKVKVTDLPQNSRAEISYSCSSCDEVYITRYGRYVKNKFELCRKCSIARVASDKEIILKRSGTNHPRYNVNLSQEDREKGRHYPEYREWREQVYIECDYTCQCCGDKRGGNLIAHHLNGWHWCKDERFTDYNGICVCESCHNKFHDIYGYSDNTREQFLEFLIAELQKKNYSEASKVFALL